MVFLYNVQMKGLLVHGCYDQSTFKTLKELGVENFGFDMRARSSNLITYKELREILNDFPSSRPVLIFSDDSRETILSFLDLLKDISKSFLLEFRDIRSKEFYESFQRPFLWQFSPEGDWMNILTSKNCEGILLPLKHKSLYRDLPHLWTLIEEKNLAIWLHAENFTEADFFNGQDNVEVSIDISHEVQPQYRSVDQLTLKSMKLWSKLNESAAGQ